MHYEETINEDYETFGRKSGTVWQKWLDNYEDYSISESRIEFGLDLLVDRAASKYTALHAENSLVQEQKTTPVGLEWEQKRI